VEKVKKAAAEIASKEGNFPEDDAPFEFPG
jgi:hypothetical protein